MLKIVFIGDTRHMCHEHISTIHVAVDIVTDDITQSNKPVDMLTFHFNTDFLASRSIVLGIF